MAEVAGGALEVGREDAVEAGVGAVVLEGVVVVVLQESIKKELTNKTATMTRSHLFIESSFKILFTD